MTYLVFFIIGAIFGSFMNFCIYRLNNGLSLRTVRSSCGQCGVILKPYDLIPILSYLILKGRCRNCSEPIPMYMLMNEMGFGILTMMIVAHYGVTLTAGFWLIFYFCFWTMAYTDAARLSVHNVILYPFMFSSACIVLLKGGSFIPWLQAVSVVAVVYVIARVLSVWKKQTMMGEGDYFILFALSLVLTIDHFINVVLLSSLLGIFVALLLHRREIPFITLLFSGFLGYTLIEGGLLIVQ